MRPASADAGESRGWRVAAAAVIALACVLRVALAFQGGQGFWPDESRYHAAANALGHFHDGQSRLAWLDLIGGADHMLFKVVCLAPAWADVHFGPSPVRAALYLGLFSTGAIALLGQCVRAAGGSRREAAFAVFLAATSSSLFYYTRHLFPYDVSLFFCLVALRLTLGPATTLKAVLAGVFAGIGFLSYDGYWILGGMVLVASVLLTRPLAGAVRRAVLGALGLCLPLVVVAVGARQSGGDLVASFLTFSGTINQGDFGYGHRFVWQYLWDAEGPLLAVWLAAFAYALWAVVTLRTRGRVLIWIMLLVLLYATLWVCADGLRVFVVYGRTARTLVPFFCLCAAWALDDAWEHRRLGRGALVAVMAAVAALAAARFATPFSQVFPEEFLEMAAQLSARGSTHLLRLLNANRLPGATFASVDGPHRIVLRKPNPLQYAPYLYEGMNEEQRRSFTTHDIAMQLVEMTDVSLPYSPGTYPGALRLRLRFPTNRPLYTEPLVTAGVAGHADFLAVRYVDPDHVRFAYDSWGAGGFLSEPVAVSKALDHDLLIFEGAMLPPDTTDTSADDRAYHERLRHDVLVVLDGTVAMAAHLPANTARPDAIALGTNFIGGSTAVESFRGSISAVESVTPAQLGRYLPWVKASKLSPGPLWDGYTGPLHFSLVVPPQPRSGSEPLLTAGSDLSDSIALAYEPNGEVRVAYTHTGEPPLMSSPIALSADRRLDLTLCIGSLMPPANSALYLQSPPLLAFGSRLWVRVNGATVLSKTVAPYPSGPGDIAILANLAHVPSVKTYFTGTLESLSAVPALELIGQLPLANAYAGAQSAPLDGHTGPLQLSVRLPSVPGARADPVLTSGVPGAGDFVYVRVLDSSHARFGIDHWGTGLTESGTVVVDPTRSTHDLLISSGALYPPPESSLYRVHPEWRTLKGRVIIVLDGHVVLNAPVATFEAKLGDVAVGFNAIGGSTTSTLFSGAILRTEIVSPDRLAALISPAR